MAVSLEIGEPHPDPHDTSNRSKNSEGPLETPNHTNEKDRQDLKSVNDGDQPAANIPTRDPGHEKTNDETRLDLTNTLTRTSTNPESRPSCFKNTTQEVLCILTATFAIAETSILIGATSGLTSHMAADLNMTQSQVTWINAATSLAAGSFLMFFGSVADSFGRRHMLLVAMFLYAIFCLVTGFANSPVYMDVMCALLGLCSAASVPPAIGILGAAYKRQSKRKNMAFATFSAGNPLGFVAGCFISGVAFQISTWRTSFWVLAVIYGFFSIAAIWCVPKDETTRATITWETFSKFDYVGVSLACSGIALFTASLSVAADASNGWRTPYVIVMLILGVLLVGAFIYWEHVFPRPLMPLYIWKDKNFCLLLIVLCLGFAGFSGNTFWLSLYWQEVEHITPLGVAIRLLPQAIVGTLVNAIAGLIMHRVSNRLLVSMGALAFTVCFALLTAFDPTVANAYWKFVFPALCLSVVGADFQFTVTNMYVMSALPSAEQSIAGGLFNTVTRLSTSIGLGISTAAYSSLNGGQSGIATTFRPYRATWWVALGMAGLSLVFVPFLTIKKPGRRTR